MLEVIFVFIYMGITCGLLGYGLLSFLSGSRFFCDRKRPYVIRHRSSYLLAGVACATVYAQLFSLFAPVGLVANLLLLVICLCIFLRYRRQMLDRLLARAGFEGSGRTRGSLPDGFLLSRGIWLLYIALFLVIAYGTSHGIMHYDTGLYHAQSIRFIEEFGVIRGLANLHSRLGYNSAFFAFSALYSFAFVNGTSLHVGNGFFALLLAFSCLDIKHILRCGRPVPTDIVRFVGIYYLFNVFKELVAPAPDIALCCYLLCLLILWVDLDVRRERQAFPYAMLAVGACFAVTIKLSSALMVLLLIKPVIQILAESVQNRHGQKKEEEGNEKRRHPDPVAYQRLAALAGLVLVTVLPWLIRNALISGWVLFPSAFPDLIPAAWKVPVDLVQGDAAYIRAFAWGFSTPEEEMLAGTFAARFRHWLSAQSSVSKLILLADLCALIGYLILLVRYTVTAVRNKKEQPSAADGKATVISISRLYRLKDGDFLLLTGVLLAAFLFWFLEAPLIRYGFFFVWTPCTLFFGRLFLQALDRLPEEKVTGVTGFLALLLTAFLFYKGIRLIAFDTTLMRSPYLLTQQPYEHFSAVPYDVDGVTFYYPAEGDRTGYFAFPGGDHQADIRLLGEDLRDGICSGR